MAVAVPPAAEIFSRAEPENAFTRSSNRTSPSSPEPRTFTGAPRRTAPTRTRSSTPTTPPAGNSSANRSRLTTWYSVRNRFVNPFSLGSRMCSGIWPPSKRSGTFLRAPVPLVPRPAVLPLEPWPRPHHGGRGHVLDRQATAGLDLLRSDQAAQGSHGGVHDVDRVRRTQRLRQNIGDPCTLQYGAHRAAGDDAGTRARRLEQDDTGGLLTLDRVWDGRANPRHPEEVLLGLFDALGDGGRDLLGLAVADADRAVTVADDDQGGKAEPAATLDDLGDPVNSHYALDVGGLLRGAATSAAVAPVAPITGGGAGGSAAAALGSWHQACLPV